MSGTQVAEKRKHPEGLTLTQALRDDEDKRKAVQKDGITKRATLIKAPDADMGALDLGGTMRPSDEQLAKINQFTRKDVTADEVVAFKTLSCNDVEDRDEDVFTTDCVKDFAALDGVYSSVGKSYMLDHEYKTANAVGRIFGVEVANEDGVTWLRNEVYIPKTERYAGLIEDIDFGINWAVSVGVTLGKSSCAICDAGFSSWGYWCQNGHDKGAYYLKDGETDQWGYPLPVDSRTKGAIKCVRNFSEPRDFYELSQVFLGAQYGAQISEKGLVAAAKSAGVPMLGISAEEAKMFSFRHEPDRLIEARRAGAPIEEGEDGVLAWKDESRVQWIFDPNDPNSEVLCLGATDDESEEDDDEGRVEQLPAGDDPNAGEGDGDVAAREAAGSGSGSVSDHPAPNGELVGREPSEEVAQDDETEEDDEMSKDKVVASAKTAALPQDVIAAAEKGPGTGLDALLLAAAGALRSQEQKIVSLEAKSAVADEYVKDLKSEALTMYVKAKQEGTQPVETATFQRLLDKCGDDIDLLKSLIEENKAVAQKKFGVTVRRSSFPTDVHERPEAPDADDPSSKKVSRLHA